MFFAGLILNDFQLFKDSSIRELSVTFTEKVQVILGTNGSGKAQPLDSLILTPSGWSPMRDINPGSVVITPDGSSAAVIATHPQGEKDIYRITFEDGRTAECCDDHLWKVYNVFWGTKNYKGTGKDTTKNRWRVVSFKDVRISMQTHKHTPGFYVPLPLPEKKEDIDLPIDPYTLGVILGDAHISKNSVVITTYDQFIADEVAQHLPLGSELKQRYTTPNNFSVVGRSQGKYQRSVFMRLIDSLGLTDTRSNNKFIPEIYFSGSYQQKLSLLQGLMDTDGTVGKIGTTSYCTVSRKLALGIRQLIRSLGGLCKIAHKVPYYTNNGERRTGQLAYILSIRIKDPETLFRLPRKIERCPKDYQYRDRLKLRIKEIECVGKKEAKCITIDHPDHLYLTNDYVVTHNSSLLRQLDPYPAVRSQFGKNGFKNQVLIKEGIYYRLESDYQKSSSPHAFYEGDSEDNLNVGRTTATQHELIVDHLGITPLVSDLIMNRLTFPKWGSAKRKEWLMQANPDQIGFVLVEIKKMASKIKACKNNIARLQARKIQLEQDLLDDDTMEMLTREKNVISEDLAAFQQNLMDIEVGLRTLGSSHVTGTINDLPAVRKTVKRCQHQLATLSHISRDDHQRQSERETTLANIAVCTQRLSETDADITQLSADLSDMETRYRELVLDGDLAMIDNTIDRLEGERDKLQIARPNFELSDDDLQNRYQELTTLQTRLQIFETLDVTLVSSKKRQHRERMLQSHQYKQSSYRMRLNDLEGQYDEWTKRHTLNPSDIPDSPCAKNRCPLYANFMSEYNTASNKRTSLLASIEKGRRKIKRLDQFVDGLITVRNRSQPYVEQIQWLIGYAQSNPILHHILRSLDILSVLSTNPNRIVRLLQDEYDRIGQWLRLKTVAADLETAYALKSRQISSESHDTIKLVSNIENTKKTLYTLRDRTQSVLTEKRQLERRLLDIATFGDIKRTILTIQDQHHRTLQAMQQGHEQKCLEFIRRGVEELRAKHFLRMSEIERVLRSQAGIRERYQEEVLSQIGIIETELADFQQIEAALIAIPKENMIGFINSVFDQANRLIETIWTVPLRIEKLKLDDPLTYEFQVSGDNESARELSECSDGQTEILSLTINLALRIILGHTNIPLALDEPGRTLDDKHKYRLISLLRRLLDDNIISQLFIVSHSALIHEGFVGIESLVIREDNILLPSEFNLHATIK